MKIGEKLKSRRIELGLSRLGVAKRIGISDQGLKNVEQGANVTLSTIEKICEELDLEFDVFVKEHETEIKKYETN